MFNGYVIINRFFTFKCKHFYFSLEIVFSYCYALERETAFVPGEFHGQRSYSPGGSQRVRHNWATENTHCVPRAKYSLRWITRAHVKTKTVSLETEGKFHCHWVGWNSKIISLKFSTPVRNSMSQYVRPWEDFILVKCKWPICFDVLSLAYLCVWDIMRGPKENCHSAPVY